jgi:hypothetical protein
VGGYFVWEATDAGPLLLVAGGSGIVPFRAIIRERQRSGSDAPVRLLYSSRTLADVIYRDELGSYGDGITVSYTLTRAAVPRRDRGDKVWALMTLTVYFDDVAGRTPRNPRPHGRSLIPFRGQSSLVGSSRSAWRGPPGHAGHTAPIDK